MFVGRRRAPLTYGQIEAVEIRLIAATNTAIAPTGYDNPAALPVSGSAVYSGTIYMTVLEDTVYEFTAFGALNMATRFDNDTVTGSANYLTGIFSETGQRERLGGTLRLSAGDIYRTADVMEEYTFAANLDGVLTDLQGQTETIDEWLADDLLGPGTFVRGSVRGDMIVMDTAIPIANGGFLGERQ